MSKRDEAYRSAITADIECKNKGCQRMDCDSFLCRDALEAYARAMNQAIQREADELWHQTHPESMGQ